MATGWIVISGAIGFIFLIVMVVYLLPRKVSAFKTPIDAFISWAFGVSTALCVVFGQKLVPVGIGQSGAALCILIWLVWIGYSLIRRNGQNDTQQEAGNSR